MFSFLFCVCFISNEDDTIQRTQTHSIGEAKLMLMRMRMPVPALQPHAC